LSSDRFFKLVRIAGIGSVLAAAALLSSCQVRPLYAESTGVVQKLANVSFSPVNTRVGLQVRNQLIFIAGRGAGETKTPQYNVDLAVSSGTAGVIYLPSSATSAAGRTTVTVAYTLKNAADGKVLKSGSRAATSLVDFSTEEFAKQRAIRDSEDRAAREAAELAAADIGAALSR
jgi:LPS-assembly lipoprotein